MAKDWVALEGLFPTKQHPPSGGVTEAPVPKNGYFNKVREDRCEVKRVRTKEVLTCQGAKIP